MSKYRRWEYVERAAPEWLERRQQERGRVLRSERMLLFGAGLRCEGCLTPVQATQFVQGEGLCLRCWSGLQG